MIGALPVLKIESRKGIYTAHGKSKPALSIVNLPFSQGVTAFSLAIALIWPILICFSGAKTFLPLSLPHFEG